MTLPIGSRFAGAKYRITPTGNPAVDTPAFEKLLVAIPTTGGVVEVADNGQSLALATANSTAVNSNSIVIDAAFVGVIKIFKPIFIRGESRSSRIEFRSGYQISWGGRDSWWAQAVSPRTTYGTMNSVAAGASQISGSSISLVRGDWVMVYGDDSIANVIPHISNGTQRPASLHRVEYNYATVANNVTTIWNVLDGHIPDTISVSPRLAKINMLRNCGLANITLGSNLTPDLSATASDGTFTPAVRVFGCLGFRVEDVFVDDSSVGWLTIDASADTIISNYSGLAVPRSSADYALVIGPVNGLLYQDSFWHNTRHVVTTGGPQSGSARYGNALATTIRNVTCYHGGNDEGSTLQAFDTHPEGYGVTFESCRVFGGGRDICRGFGCRARRTTFRNCEFVSNVSDRFAAFASKNENKGFVICGWRSMIDGCRVQGAWQGVVYDTVVEGLYQHDHHVRNTTFEGVTSNPIYTVRPMNRITVANCHFEDCATQYNGDEQSPVPNPVVMGSVINIRGGTGHRILSNVIDRHANTYSLSAGTLTPADLVFEGNHVRGYTSTYSSGTNKIGVRGDTGDPKGVSTTTGPSFQSTYAARNYTS
jgi:hypothetical protein